MRFLKLITYIFLICITISFNSFAQNIIPEKIRIGLYYLESSKNSVELYSDTGFDIGENDTETFTSLLCIPEIKNIIIKKGDTNSEILVLGKSGEELLKYSASQGLKIFAIDDKELPNVISVNGTKYRGAVIVKRQKGSDMTIINEVSFKHYLYSVVPSEMPRTWHIEALKSQSVAARTYAVNNLLYSPRVSEYGQLGFDMNATTQFQVYNGFISENEITNIAVDETNDEIIYYDDKPISAFFFSCSGGYTENSENVWVSPIEYLRGVEDKYLLPEDIKHKSWEVKVTPQELTNQYSSQGIDIGKVKDIEVTKYTPNGNALELTVTGTKGTKTYEKLGIRGFVSGKYLNSLSFNIIKNGEIIQSVINSNLKVISSSINNKKVMTKDGIKDVSSTVYIKDKTTTRVLSASSDEFVLKGIGAGHGVGMSQYGAKGMAEAGFEYDEILKYYYTDVEIR